MNARLLTLALASAALLSTAAVQAKPDDHTHYGGPRATVPHEHGDFLAFGRPGKEKWAARTIPLIATDDNRYSVPAFTVEQGETVKFVLTNAGMRPHQFVLGDAKTQRLVEAGSFTERPNAVTLAPGESKTLVWKFDRFGVFQIACHEPGAYQAGMVSYVTVPMAPKRGWR